MMKNGKAFDAKVELIKKMGLFTFDYQVQKVVLASVIFGSYRPSNSHSGLSIIPQATH
jgi:hypothetical protein